VSDPYGVAIVGSDLVEPGTVFIMNPDTLKVLPINLEPVTTRGQAAKIVQEGLSGVVAWLRATGHKVPHWSTIDEQQQFVDDMPRMIRDEIAYRYSQIYAANYGSLVKVTGL
jgi:hypothetical protein